MDKSSDSSDSDSNSSTSWVFVEDPATADNKNGPNTFHLDCSREPIQELTEQDLLSGGSDFESDTDGVSVISESEVPVEESYSYSGIQFVSSDLNETPETKIGDDCEKDKEGEEETVDLNDNKKEPTEFSNDNVEDLHSESLMTVEENGESSISITDLIKQLKPLHLLGVGFVLIAVCIASYNQIMTKMNEKDLEKNDVDIGLYDKVDLTSTNNDLGKICNGKHNWERQLGQNDHKLRKVKRDVDKRILDKKYSFKNDDENLEKIIDITVACAFHENPTSDMENKAIKECATKEYHKQTDHLRKKKADDSLWVSEKKKMKYNHKYTKVIDNNEYQIKVDARVTSEIPQDEKYLKVKKNRNDIVKNKEDKVYKRENKKTKHNSEEVNKEVHKNKYNKKYQSEENKNYREHDKVHKKKDKNKSEFKQAKNYKNKDSSEETFKYEKHKKYKHYKCPEKMTLTNKIKKFKSPKKIDENYRNKHNRGLLKGYKQNNTGGEWYINLYRARDQMRKQEHVSDWIFDRAQMRSQKRNKAQWYFKWMNIREQLRYKRSYKPYSS